MSSVKSSFVDNTVSIQQLPNIFEEAATNMSGADLGRFQRDAKQLFCQACYEGDIKKVLFFLDRLPKFFVWLSKECLNDSTGVSWACYGRKTNVVRLISERQDPEIFIGFDFDVALEILHQARDEGSPLKAIEYDQWHGRSTVEAIHKVAVRENNRELLLAVADIIEKNLDRFFQQIRV